MGNTIKYLPGPSVAEEYTSLEALFEAICEYGVQKLTVASLGFGETGTGPWYCHGSSPVFTANSGQPYIQITFDDTPGTSTVQVRLRFASGLAGLLDPGSWFPSLFHGLSLQNRASWDAFHQRNAGSRWASIVQSLGTVFYNAGLCRSPIGNYPAQVYQYTYGLNVGKAYGLTSSGYYNPNSSEQLPPPDGPGLKRRVWIVLEACTDFNDGTVTTVSSSINYEANYSQVPQIVAENPGQQQSWTELGDGVDALDPRLQDVKDSIDNALPIFMGDHPEVSDFMTKTPKAWRAEDPDCVTHASDQATDPHTPYVANPSVALFSTPGAAAGLLSNAPAILELSKPVAWRAISSLGNAVSTAYVLSTGVIGKLADAAVALKDTSLQLTGGALALIADGGLALREIVQAGIDNYFDKVVELVDWATSSDGTPQRIRDAQEQQADSLAEATDYLRRIAEAMEAIKVETVRDPTNLAEYPGLIGAIEVNTQTKTEMEIQYHGLRVNAATGATGMEQE